MSNDTSTPNVNLAVIDPNRNNWASAMNKNLRIIDAVFGTYFDVTGIIGVWANSTTYAVGNVVIDTVAGTLWTCRAAHISASLPTIFSEDRTAHSTYWTVIDTAPLYRGTWATNSSYSNNDFVLLSDVYYVCRTTHIAGTFATDLAAGKWEVLLDMSTAVTSAAAAAVSAAAAVVSASAASASATTASTQATNAAASAVAAAASAVDATTQAANAATSASTATTQATNASNSATTASTQATNASNSATDAANYAAALTSTSTTSLLIAVASKTFTIQSGKQYAAGQFISAVSAANNANYMHGQVTSYSGTSLVMNVTNIGGSGTLNDWNIAVSGSRGATGASTNLTVGSTVVAGGATTRILYDNAGTLGEYTISGTGTEVVMSNSPTLITPALGTPASGVMTNMTGAVVAGGGTGVATLTAYAPIFGGTTATGPVQSGTVGTAGQILTSNGASALPTFKTAPPNIYNALNFGAF